MVFENVTITIPLYRSIKFKDIVLKNIEKLVGACNIIISDCTEEDNLLQDIKTLYLDFPNVRIIGKRNIGEGWVLHWNDLMNQVDTEYFMWLSHDDEIDLSWISENMQNLKNNPQLAGSFGLLERVFEDGSLMEFGARFPGIVDNKRNFRANQLIEGWHLAIALRAVWNKSKVFPFLRTYGAQDEWADVVWVYGVLLEHPIDQISIGSYRKRWHAGSAHADWTEFDLVVLLPFLKQEIERRNLSLEIFGELFEICEGKIINQRREWNELLNSTFWRITAPLRTFMRIIKQVKN
jgi:hypothetical protein